MSEAKPGLTPLPWRIGGRVETWSDEADALVDSGEVSRIEGADGEHVCGTCDGCNNIKGADAELMLRAVNSHADLVAALRRISDIDGDSESRDIADAALRKAGVES